MTEYVELYSRRIAELEKLVDAHVRSGSLDEGNSDVFDAIIDAWLEDELMRAEQLLADDNLARTKRADRLARRMAAIRWRRERRQERRRARAGEVSAYWNDVTAAVGDASSRRRSRRRERAGASRRRLDAARVQVEVSRAHLAGAARPSTGNGPLAAPRPTTTQHDAAVTDGAVTDDRTAEKVA